MYLAMNKSDAIKYLAREKEKLLKQYNPDQLCYKKPNLKRKYPVFMRESAWDLTRMNGDVDIWVEFYPLTHEIKKKIVKHSLKGII